MAMLASPLNALPPQERGKIANRGGALEQRRQLRSRKCCGEVEEQGLRQKPGWGNGEICENSQGFVRVSLPFYNAQRHRREATASYLSSSRGLLDSPFQLRLALVPGVPPPVPG